MIFILCNFDFEMPDWMIDMKNGEHEFFNGQKIGYDPDYNSDDDLELQAWREAQKPPIIQNASYVENISEISNSSHFHFFYHSNFNSKNDSINLLKSLNFSEQFPLYFSDCSKGKICAELKIKFLPMFSFVAADQRVQTATIELETVENFIKMIENSSFYGEILETSSLNEQFAVKYKGIQKFSFSEKGQIFTSQAAFDSFYSKNLNFRPGSIENYFSCKKVLIVGNGEFLNEIELFLDEKSYDVKELVCWIQYEEWKDFLYQEWFITEDLVPCYVVEEEQFVVRIGEIIEIFE